MRLPTVSQMVDENTIAYWPFDGNGIDYAGGGGVWYNYNMDRPQEVLSYIYDDTIDRQVLYYSNGFNSIGSQIISNVNSTIDFIFRPVRASEDHHFIVFASNKFNRTRLITMNFDYNDRRIKFKEDNNISYWYDTDIYYTWHHMVITIENNSLFKVYLDGKFVLSGSYNISSFTYFGFFVSNYYNSHNISLIDYRVSKGLRWTEDFVGQTPLDDVRWTIKENNNNIYGVKKG